MKLPESMNYKEYLQTEHWQLKREQALKYFNYECSACGTKFNLNVHHKRYDNLFEEKIEDLAVFCKRCHNNFHERDNQGNSLADREAKARMVKDVRTLNVRLQEEVKQKELKERMEYFETHKDEIFHYLFKGEGNEKHLKLRAQTKRIVEAERRMWHG